MTNAEAIGILAVVVETEKGRCFVTDEAISEAYAMAISALQAQEAKTQLSAEGTTSDLISRQDVIDIVTGYSGQLNGYIGTPNDTDVYAYARGLILGIERNLNALQSAQTEIRCKDCKYHHYEKDIPYCDRIDYGYGWKDNDYCSRAERRTDAD